MKKIIFLGLILSLILTPIISSANTNTGKTIENGIYNIAVGKISNKSVEVAGSINENNGKVDIWNYRKCTCSEILF